MEEIEEELREWMRLEEGDDSTLSSLLIAARAIIKKGSGLSIKDIQNKNDEELTETYKTLQKIIVTRLYENRESTKEIDSGLTSLYWTLRSLGR